MYHKKDMKPTEENVDVSLPRVPKIKIQDESHTLFSKILNYKQYHVKVLLTRFHLNGHTIGFHPQTQKLEAPSCLNN